MPAVILACVSPFSVAQEQAFELEVIDVEGVAPSSSASAQPGSELSDEALRQAVAATLGETLAGQPGVSNASFGPGVGLPVVRGLTGTRVRLMQDGIGSHDASWMSPDHASTLEAGLADRIEVLRGPAVLKHGGRAIGGVVNVVDRRVPDGLPDAPVTGAVETRYETNGNGRSAAFQLDAGKGRFAVHADGLFRRRGDVDVPGDALDLDALNEQFGPDDYVTSTGRIDNTDVEVATGSVGASYVGEDGFAGLAVSHYRNEYGVPPGFHVDGGVPQEVRIDASQTRLDFKAAAYEVGDAFPELRLRAGYVGYEHEEFEDGRSGTRFDNETVEATAALDFERTPSSDDVYLEGTVGLQILDREFSAIGEEAFVPHSSKRALGFFATETRELDRLRLEYGARVDLQRVEQLEAIDCTGLGRTFERPPEDYAALSLSGAAFFELSPSVEARLSLSRAQRAPELQELLACGPHLATQTYDLAFSFDGDDTLDVETFNTVDFGIAWSNDAFTLDASVFYYRIDDFIFQRNLSSASNGPFYNPDRRLFQGTCASASQCLPVLQYTQSDARMVGFEVALDVPLEQRDDGSAWSLELFSDYVRARLDSGEDVPRMPPLRFGAGLSFERPNLTAELRFTRALAQTRPGENETRTPGYNLLNASLSYTHSLRSSDATVYVNARNLLDEDIRSSTSFLRSYAPEPGRGLELGLRVEF